MKRITIRLLLAGLALAFLSPLSVAADLAIRAERIFPGDGPVIENGTVLVKNGKIVAVGPANQIQIPAGVQILDAVTVTPGLVDVHSVVGLAGVYNSDRGRFRIKIRSRSPRHFNPNYKPSTPTTRKSL